MTTLIRVGSAPKLGLKLRDEDGSRFVRRRLGLYLSRLRTDETAGPNPGGFFAL